MTPAMHSALQALVDVVLGERADRSILEPTLVAALRTEINDFIRYHPVEFAAQRVLDHEVLVRDARYRRQPQAAK